MGLEQQRAGSSARGTRPVPDRQSANPVILVDEIYKSGSRWSGNARVETLTTTLLGLLEPETTRSWECCHTQLRFDMSRICWILTSNDAKAIPAPLKDCCRVLSMRSPVLGRSGGPPEDHLHPRECRQPAGRGPQLRGDRDGFSVLADMQFS